MKNIFIIAAMAQNRVIGNNNTLPWRIPADLKRFKEMTIGNDIIMGHNTYKSIGRPLPDRKNIVVSRNADLQIDGCYVANSLKEAIDYCGFIDKIFIVGGARIYASAMNLAGTIYLTEIQKNVPGDVYFPEFDKSQWIEAAREKCMQEAPEKLEYDFVTYIRKSKK